MTLTRSVYVLDTRVELFQGWVRKSAAHIVSQRSEKVPATVSRF